MSADKPSERIEREVNAALNRKPVTPTGGYWGGIRIAAGALVRRIFRKS